MTCTQCVQWANRRSIHRRVMRSWLHVWMLISHLGYEPPPSRPRSSVSEDICGCSSGISPSKSSWHWRFAADTVVPPVIVHSAWTHTGMTGTIPLHNPPVSLRALVIMTVNITEWTMQEQARYWNDLVRETECIAWPHRLDGYAGFPALLHDDPTDWTCRSAFSVSNQRDNKKSGGNHTISGSHYL